ncbi:SDR family NAD(P)-dependent oxidoreductase [Sphingobium yanoikuyae]|uniref:Oxidoreductase n=1 Tax=Sphingobium yanoikuyae TaxID=13690 RepID=A0A291N0C0_SPHYA|nr:SDR family NAD(P)-dependent oxidoreductase [Sphingobium yanoikuyae]ATI80655.1 oxidoreductase [Sphingobium yanoikuyae]
MPEPRHYLGKMRGQTAIVTGAGTQGDGVGTGQAIAVVLAGEGAAVGLVDREADRAEATRGRIVNAGGKAFVMVGDVTDNSDCQRFVEEAVAQTGRLDILVNNVGISTPVALDDVDEHAWNRVIDVNLKSAMLMIRHAVPAMKATGGGSIVNISSIAGVRAHGSIAYGPSKAALAALAREIAVLHGRDGIRANTVAPGHIMTPHAMHVLPSDARTLRQEIGPLGMEGDAWDIAQAVAFLASDEARFITGVLLPVDGGVTEIGPIAAHMLVTNCS